MSELDKNVKFPKGRSLRPYTSLLSGSIQNGGMSDSSAYSSASEDGCVNIGTRYKIMGFVASTSQPKQATTTSWNSNVHQPIPGYLQNRFQSAPKCNFCQGNGESNKVVFSHNLREGHTLTCPILRAYICPICGSTGDTAHTVSYCPWNKEKPVAKAVRSCLGHNSAGKRRDNK